MKYNIGIIGKGFVGTAMYDNFTESEGLINVNVWDILPTKRTVETFEEFVAKSEIIFVSVPTPSNPNGSCNTSIVEQVVESIAAVDNSKLVVIKSTVPPGTTEALSSRYGMTIAFNPEFLTEANAYNDFRNQSLIVIGADQPETGEKLRDFYREFMYLDGNSELENYVIAVRRSKEAEMFKYLANSFLATKVIFANEFSRLCEKVGVDYSRIASMAVRDDRLGATHWKVPGPDRKYGFGGSCFPKDTRALLSYAEENSIDLWLLAEACYINENIRG